ncbi:MAG TPA: hypothetical protein VKU84_16325 [Stellaceae bacterium]|nr:hypothetical protein [Stellaceae bacterium]
MSLLRTLFGPSKEEVWRELSGQIGGEFLNGGMWRGDKVTAHVGPWIVVLDTYTVSTGKSAVTFTRMRAPYVNRDGFRFTLYRTTMFTALGKFLGMQDIPIDDPTFDEAFVVKTNDAAQARALLADPRLRELLLQQPSIHFSVKDDEGMFGPAFGESVDELYFEVVGILKDIERLKSLFDLFAETLHWLCHIGSAYETDPNLPVARPPADALVRASDAPPDSGNLLRPTEQAGEADPDRLLRPADETDQS